MLNNSVRTLAERIASKNGLTDIEVEVKPGSKKGDGFLGDIFMVSVKNGNNNIEMIFKCALVDEKIVSKFFVKEVYDNELHFYRTIVPTIKKFEKDTGIVHRFTAVAKYFGSHFEHDIRIIAMENLRIKGFELFNKKATVDGNHVAMVFTQYGRYHAFSFAYRQQHPKEFSELVKPLINIWNKFSGPNPMRRVIENICKDIHEMGLEIKLAERFEKYLNTWEIFKSVSQYQGKYSALLHGDCWTNNMMFKYNVNDEKKQLTDMCFLDWQLCCVGTPVFDLSYFLYSSASKEIFDDLDHYLKVYHNSFSTTISEMGLDPETMFPFSALKADWKRYCRYGFILGLFLQRIKLVKDDEIKDLHDVKDVDHDTGRGGMLESSFERDIFEERAKNLVLHMYEIDAL